MGSKTSEIAYISLLKLQRSLISSQSILSSINDFKYSDHANIISCTEDTSLHPLQVIVFTIGIKQSLQLVVIDDCLMEMENIATIIRETGLLRA